MLVLYTDAFVIELNSTGLGRVLWLLNPDKLNHLAALSLWILANKLQQSDVDSRALFETGVSYFRV